MTVEGVEAVLRGVWARDTSAAPGWTPAMPEFGHGAVSALIVQDELGGVLLRAVNCGVSHYWNLLDSGLEVDLTRGQFNAWDPDGATRGDRSYVLSCWETELRYYLLELRYRAAKRKRGRNAVRPGS